METRRRYETMARSLGEIRKLAAEKFAWPGGYPMYGIMKDGAAICCDCITKEWEQIEDATKDGGHTGWEIEGIDINYEDEDCYCCNCGERIESAHGEE